MFTVVDWDWKEQPSVPALNAEISAVYDPECPQAPSIAEVPTGGDSYAVVVSTRELTPQGAKAAYEAWWDELDAGTLDGTTALPDERLQ